MSWPQKPSDSGQKIWKFKKEVNGLGIIDQRYRTIFHQAVIENEFGVIKSILMYKSLPFDLNAVDKDHMTALDYAISLSSDDIFELLINDPRINVNCGGKILNSSFNYCVNLLCFNYIEQMLKKSKVDLSITDKDGNNLFHLIMKWFKRNVAESNKILAFILENCT